MNVNYVVFCLEKKMKCVIPNHCIKLFARSIHCLAKIGDELFLEALKDGLAIRTVNSSRSAYACFIYSTLFFTEYEQRGNHNNEDCAEFLKCKLTMKSCLSIFKSLANIEKTVQKCHIEFKPEKCRLIFSLYCHHGIIKTHHVTYQECESLQATFSKELCPNQIVAQTKILQDTVMNFPVNCAEISLLVTPEKVSIKNYIDDEPDPSKVVHTEMSLVPEEFDDFQIGIDTQITFCLKELKAILSFSEFANQPIAIRFEQPGKPIVFSLTNDQAYTCDFVMSTLAENEDGTTQQTINNSVSNSSISKNGKDKCVSVKKKTLPKNSNCNISNENEKLVDIDHPMKDVTKVTNDKHKTISTKEKYLALKKERKKNENSLNISNLQIVPDDEILKGASKNVSGCDPFFSSSFPYEDIIRDDMNQSQNNAKNISLLQANTEISFNLATNDDDILMGTPPARKKFRSSFFASQDYNNTINEKMDTTSKPALVLVDDTDDED